MSEYPISTVIADLFTTLQKEYIICKLRSQIYPIQKHKDYWSNLANQKKMKINDISIKNELESIFSNNDLKIALEKEIFDKCGLPEFYYPKEDIREQQRNWDIKNYFGKGNKVIFNNMTFTICKLNIEEQTVEIDFNKNNVEISFSEIKRIL